MNSPVHSKKHTHKSSKQRPDSLLSVSIVLLGAGFPFHGITPSFFKTFGQSIVEHKVLDWLLHAFSSLHANIQFIGGYGLQEVIDHYPNLQVRVNPEWKNTGSLGSLFCANLDKECDYFISYTDIVYRPKIVASLRRAPGDVVAVIDSQWRTRTPRTLRDLKRAERVSWRDNMVVAAGPELPLEISNAEFIGLLRLSPVVTRMVAEWSQRDDKILLSRAHLGTLLALLLEEGFSITALDVAGQWTELNSPQDMARFQLGTKAETLERLQGLVRHSRIGCSLYTTQEQWQRGSHAFMASVRHAIPEPLLAVRSSAISEDSWQESNAGAFLTLLNVPNEDNALGEAIDRIFVSYSNNSGDQQVLVQGMVRDAVTSGVVLTRGLRFGAPYYTVNYENTNNITDGVTSGKGQHLETIVIARSALKRFPLPHPFLEKLLIAVCELESLVGHDTLDIEFVIDRAGEVHILQIRPIVLDAEVLRPLDDQVARQLEHAEFQYGHEPVPIPGFHPLPPLFGNMPDWNPAEIIGTQPRRLAVSLYRYLITDETWARQRAAVGYRDVRPRPLMHMLGGHAYVDVRASFASFVPASLADSVAERLVSSYLGRLKKHPEQHDKVEFDTVLTCLPLDFPARADWLLDCGFSKLEIHSLQEGLAMVTRKIIAQCGPSLQTLTDLDEAFPRFLDATAPALERTMTLLHLCREQGVLPFAHLARGAFVAVELLRSSVRLGFLSPERMEQFLGTVNSISMQFIDDIVSTATGQLSWSGLVARYGHLRPRTYDITIPCYASDPERYLRPLIKRIKRPTSPRPFFKLTRSEGLAWDHHFRQCGMDMDANNFLDFARSAIEGRERGKFIFSRPLNQALEDLRHWGKTWEISSEHLSYVSLDDLRAITTGEETHSFGQFLRQRAQEGLDAHEVARRVQLPPLICSPADLHLFQLPRFHANFVTAEVITAEGVVLESGFCESVAMAGRIVLIRQADPGFDWIFGHAIVGLITAYGGANSHMTIRAAEFGLPSAIGVGEPLFNRLVCASVIHLDCQLRKVEPGI